LIRGADALLVLRALVFAGFLGVLEQALAPRRDWPLMNVLLWVKSLDRFAHLSRIKVWWKDGSLHVSTTEARLANVLEFRGRVEAWCGG